MLHSTEVFNDYVNKRTLPRVNSSCVKSVPMSAVSIEAEIILSRILGRQSTMPQYIVRMLIIGRYVYIYW